MSINEAWFVKQAKRLPPGCLRPESSVATAKMIYGLVSITQPQRVVEVGTYLGDTTAWIGRALIERRAGRCTSYDVDKDLQAAARENLTEALGEDAPVDLVLEDITKRTEPVECEFVFIDPAPKSLYLDVFAKLKMPRDGTLCAHDLTLKYDGKYVADLKNHLLDSKEWEVIGFPQERGLLVARKIG